jgi:hypothetical protein
MPLPRTVDTRFFYFEIRLSPPDTLWGMASTSRLPIPCSSMSIIEGVHERKFFCSMVDEILSSNHSFPSARDLA